MKDSASSSSRELVGAGERPISNAVILSASALQLSSSSVLRVLSPRPGPRPADVAPPRSNVLGETADSDVEPQEQQEKGNSKKKKNRYFQWDETLDMHLLKAGILFRGLSFGLSRTLTIEWIDSLVRVHRDEI